jgi:hypothetical protein
MSIGLGRCISSACPVHVQCMSSASCSVLADADGSQTGAGFSLDPCSCVQSSPQDRFSPVVSGDMHPTSRLRQTSPISTRLFDWPYHIGAIGMKRGWSELWRPLLYLSPEYRRTIARLPSRMSHSAVSRLLRRSQSARNLPPQTRSGQHVLEEQMLTVHGKD